MNTNKIHRMLDSKSCHDNYNNNLKGSRTPFIDYRTGQNIYNQRGFTPGQNQYNDIPNRPPSRPFGDISFKGQNNGQDMGNRGKVIRQLICQ